jgi:hypothetical protein
MRLIIILIALLPGSAFAASWCDIKNFTVDAYDHGGVYLKGELHASGVNPYVKRVSYVVLVGNTEGATNRRTSVALAAQMGGKDLELYFKDLNECSNFDEYTTATTIRIKLD